MRRSPIHAAPLDSPAAAVALRRRRRISPLLFCLPCAQGKWVAPDIPNPEYVDDTELYAYKDLKYLGFELWQVKSGSIFDSIIVTDSLEEAKAFAEATWGKTKDGEKEMFEADKKQVREQHMCSTCPPAGARACLCIVCVRVFFCQQRMHLGQGACVAKCRPLVMPAHPLAALCAALTRCLPLPLCVCSSASSRAPLVTLVLK